MSSPDSGGAAAGFPQVLTPLEFPLEEAETLRKLATRIRYHTLHMTRRGKSSHIGSCFSSAEILAVLYGKTLRVDISNPRWPERDRFIMGKGHASAALYAVLGERGFFPLCRLESFYVNGASLPGHVSHHGVPGVEASTGSLGHGLPIACGQALWARRSGESQRVFCLLSDGECDEGSTWEAALFAPHHGLANLTAIVDFNKIQSLGNVQDVLALEPLADKWAAFGWAVQEVDGHDVVELNRVFDSIPLDSCRPTCFIAHTTKGKGVSFMEEQLLWHYRSPQGAEFDAALKELEPIE